MKAIATIIMFIASVVLLAWVARPVWDDIGSLRAQVANINDVLSSLNEKKQFQQDLITTYNSITEEQLDTLLNQHLPEKSDTGTLLIALERIATASNIRLNNIDFKKVEQPKLPGSLPRAKTAGGKSEILPYQELEMTFNVTATYENFKMFLRSLETHVRVIDIGNINFGSGQKDVYTFTISAKTYYRK